MGKRKRAINVINQIFNLEGTLYIALCDLLKACSIANSGGQAKHMIGLSLVSVNGQIETRKRAKIVAGSVVTGADFRIDVHAVK